MNNQEALKNVITMLRGTDFFLFCDIQEAVEAILDTGSVFTGIEYRIAWFDSRVLHEQGPGGIAPNIYPLLRRHGLQLGMMTQEVLSTGAIDAIVDNVRFPLLTGQEAIVRNLANKINVDGFCTARLFELLKVYRFFDYLDRQLRGKTDSKLFISGTGCDTSVIVVDDRMTDCLVLLERVSMTISEMVVPSERCNFIQLKISECFRIFEEGLGGDIHGND